MYENSDWCCKPSLQQTLSYGRNTQPQIRMIPDFLTSFQIIPMFNREAILKEVRRMDKADVGLLPERGRCCVGRARSLGFRVSL